MSAPKTKWQEFMDKPKGSVTYNPAQTFALHVFWVVRSSKAAREMIEKGFRPCSDACHRDTPATLCYLFRISHNHQLAETLRHSVQTIGQHPHYEASFRSIEMGLSKLSQETKLRMGGIDTAPLSWPKDTPLTPELAKQLDFDPVVLECTEVYLDNQSFYEHAASRDWMKHSPEILKACRSLKPTTFCLGTPDDKIWESAIEGSLKAIRFDREQGPSASIRPGIFVKQHVSGIYGSATYVFEFDLQIAASKVDDWRNDMEAVFQKFGFLFMLVLPTNTDAKVRDLVDVRIMVVFSAEPSQLSADYIPAFEHLCASVFSVQGRLIVFGDDDKNVNELLKQSKLHRITVDNAQTLKERNELAGYAIHSLASQLQVENNKFYQI